MRRCYFSLGSNVGDRVSHLRTGIDIVRGTDPYRISQVYETEPVGGVVQDDFWNLVLEVETDASPLELLERAHAAETACERTREVHWGPRTLDVDVLLVGDEISENPDVLVPHPRMYERAFVLIPLQELAPQLVPKDLLNSVRERVVPLGTLDLLR